MDVKMLRHLLPVCLLVVLSGCNTTAGSGHLNPDFDGYELAEIAIDVRPRSDLADLVEAKLGTALAARGVKSYKTSDITRFARDDGEALTKMAERGAHGVMLVQLSDTANAAVIGAQTYGTASANHYQATTVPVVAPMRRIDASIMVYATRPGFKGVDLAVDGSATGDAGGLLYIGNDSMAAEITSGIIEALSQAGVMPQ